MRSPGRSPAYDEAALGTGAADAAGPSVDVYLMRWADITIATLLLVFFTPILLAVALSIKVQDGGPILFAHTRLGRHGKPFREEWRRDHKLRCDPRVTWLGLFLRKSSLDELPQLINVLRGEMSLVGPRPIVAAEVDRYGRRFRDYCQVRPGVTGLWQIGGRNDTSYRRRVAYDVLYVRDRSLQLYFNVVVLTVPAVIMRRGSY